MKEFFVHSQVFLTADLPGLGLPFLLPLSALELCVTSFKLFWQTYLNLTVSSMLLRILDPA